MPSFLSSIADKAQSALNASPLGPQLSSIAVKAHSALNATPLGPHLPSSQPAAEGTNRSYAFDAIQYQLRSLGQQYTTTTPLRKLITIEKGVAIDFDGVSRDSKAQSKELFNWGKSEREDIKDVTDRLAYLNFVQGSLANALAVKLDAARIPLKAVRDSEAALTPRRNFRAGLQTQISRLEHDRQSGMEKRLAELKAQLRKAENEDEQPEKQVALLKRSAIKESEQAKWNALREFGEKLILISQAASPIIAALPSVPPSEAIPYAGAPATAAARASLQHALDNYKTGHINLPTHPATSGSDTRSFGESHATELSVISSDHRNTEPGIPLTPPLSTSPLPAPSSSPPSNRSEASTHPALGGGSTNPIDPYTLNNSPTQLPSHAPLASSVAPADDSTQQPPLPTVAETGLPLTAGAQGPGPASGSLHDIRGPSTAGPHGGAVPVGVSGQSRPAFGGMAAVSSTAGSGTQRYESAEDEKRRLQREDRERQTSSQPTPAASSSGHESAEAEKSRLEREERERLLRDSRNQENEDLGGDEELPPYS